MINIDFFTLENDLEEIIKSKNKNNQEVFSIINNFFKLFIEELADDEKTVFHNFYSKYKYAILKLNLSEDIKEEFNYFRRFLNTKNEFINSEEIEKVVNTFLLLVSYIKLENEWIVKYKELNNFYFTEKYSYQQKDLTNIELVVDSISDILDFQWHNYFVISWFINWTWDIVKIRLNKHIINYNWYNKIIDFSYLKDCVDKWTNILFKNLWKIENEENKFFTVPDKTLIIIEPDYLLEASWIEQCFVWKIWIAELYFLNLISSSEKLSDKAFQWNIVWNILDYKVRWKANNYNYLEIFEELFKKDALSSSIFWEYTLNSIKNNIINLHIPNLDKLAEKVEDKKVWIEPTYYSNEYGLFWRIDLLFQENWKMNLVELKSWTPSNPKFSQTWLWHKMQSVCYNMMLETTYWIDKKWNTSVFYSLDNEDNKNPMRIIISEYDENRNVLEIRNKIISYITQIANKNYFAIDKLINTDYAVPSFISEKIEEFSLKYKNDSIFKNLFNELISFSFRELLNWKIWLYDNSKKEVVSMAFLWNKSIEDKKEKFILLEMNLENIDNNNNLMYFTYDILDTHSFRENDMIIIYPEINWEYKPLKNHILKWTIQSIIDNKIIIKLSYEQNSYDTIKTFSKWCLESEFYEAWYKQTIWTLSEILSNSKMDLLLGIKEPLKNQSIKYLKNEKLNDNQNNILNNALSSQNYYLLQWPPWTWKTSTFLINYIKENLKLKDKNYKIFLTAFTNKAISTICKSLDNPRDWEKIKYINFWWRWEENPSLYKNIIEDKNIDDWLNIILENNVFVCTVNQLYSIQKKLNWVEWNFNFNEIIVDEASQLTDASLLWTLLKFNKFILIWDHLQLPAVVTQDETLLKVDNQELNNLWFDNLWKSLFERLFINAYKKWWKDFYWQFINHYRMHQDIADLIKDWYIFWLEEWLNKQKEKSIIHNCFWNILDTNRNVFINKSKWPCLKKDTNEAKIVFEIIQKIINEWKYKAEDIWIISPFKAHISEIKKLLQEEKYNWIQIDTVERYQWDEKKIVIYTTVVNEFIQLNWIKNEINIDWKIIDRKLLVAISRAIEQFIMIWNEEVLNLSNYYKEIIDKIKIKWWFI